MKKSMVIITVIIASGMIIQSMAETGELKPIDYSSPVIQAVVAYQKAFRTGDTETLWKQLAKDMRRPHKKYVLLKGRDPNPYEEKRNVALGNAQLIGMRFITNNRVWVEINVTEFPGLKGFFFIREDGEWKFAHITLYIDKAKEDIQFLARAIKNYYRENKKLPQTLSDLLKPTAYVDSLPSDPFNDDQTPYVYKVINKFAYRLYSLGPDSDDNQGVIEYKAAIDPITDSVNAGDIIMNYSFKR